MSYIQIEIGGKLRGLKFNQGAHVEIFNKIGQANNNVVFAGYAVVWAGLKANSYVKGEEIDFTFEQVCDWVDAMKEEDLLKMTDCYKSTVKFMDDLPEEKSKKKLPQKNTKRNALKQLQVNQDGHLTITIHVAPASSIMLARAILIKRITTCQ